MYFSNGYVCGGSPAHGVKITDAKALNNLVMILKLSTGEERLFDATVLTGESFEMIKNEKTFKDFTLDHGVITWLDGQVDCSPEYMIEHSLPYERAIA